MAAELIWVTQGTEGWMLAARDGLDVGHIIRYGRDLIGYAVGDDYPDGEPRLTRGDVLALPMVMDAVRERAAAVEATRRAAE